MNSTDAEVDENDGAGLPVSLWLLVGVAILSAIWSVIGTHQLDVWVFELLPGTIGVIGLVLIARKFRFSSLVYVVIAVAFVMIATGARYTYSDVPLFNWLQDVLHLSRNHFDRLGHYVQGLTVALMTREVLLRTSNLNRHRGVAILTIAFALGFSALYELLEWQCVVLFYPSSGPEWLGMQGDVWDAQWDMAMAFLGAITATYILFPLHDRTIGRLL